MMRFCIIYFCFFLVSCQQKVADNYGDATLAPAVEASTATASPVDTSTFAPDSMVQLIDDSSPLAISNQSVRLLFTGAFHGNEVEIGVDSLPWLGLFPGDSGDFFLQETTVVTKRVLDALLDDEASGEKTGWEISTTTDDPMMLVWQKDLSEGFVNGLGVPNTINPGDSIHIEFLGVRYLLTATGSSQSHSYGVTVSNYRLHLSRTENGTTIRQTLVTHAAFDDAITSVLWSGDLDRDGYLDLLIDMSNHYNWSAPTLFLSKPAGAENVVVQVAQHSSVGC